MTAQERDEVFGRAEPLRIDGNYDAAAPLYEQILAALPNDHDAMLGRAYCQLNIGLFDEAIEAFTAAKRVDPGHIRGRLELAKACAMLGMYAEARREFNAVLKQEPDNEAALEQLEYFPDDIEAAPEEDDLVAQPVAPADEVAAADESPAGEPAPTQSAGTGADLGETCPATDDELEFF